MTALERDVAAAREEMRAAQADSEAKASEAERLAAELRELMTAKAALEQELTAARDAAKRSDAQAQELAGRVSPLAAYRPAFLDQLRAALGENSGAVIQGERFILPSEVLFASGSADLTPTARTRVIALGRKLKELTGAIPADVDWLLRVDGHTDRVPIKGGAFKTNRELSAARAIAVVQALVEAGLSPSRLAATGFGPYRPIDTADTPEAFRANRRIELRLTEG